MIHWISGGSWIDSGIRAAETTHSRNGHCWRPCRCAMPRAGKNYFALSPFVAACPCHAGFRVWIWLTYFADQGGWHHCVCQWRKRCEFARMGHYPNGSWSTQNASRSPFFPRTEIFFDFLVKRHEQDRFFRESGVGKGLWLREKAIGPSHVSGPLIRAR